MGFPKNFVWGAATSAYQIEGGWNADGKGPSNWDAFSHDRVPAGFVGNIPGQVFSPGNVAHNHTGDVSCDHYHRFEEDVGLMKQIGLRAYRLSISWARVMPDGTGKVNEAGIAFYERLIDALLAAGITPWVTLFHWDMPLALWHKGAWHNRDIADAFAAYAQVIVDRLSDRVTNWMTINEPQIFLGPGELEGLQTSNARASHAQRLLAAHHSLLAHGRAVQVIRARAKKPPTVGWAPIGRVRVPATDAMADIDAARRATLSVFAKDHWNNTWFADPIVFGHYPEDGLRLYGPDAPTPHAGDMATINQKIDFYGINVYDAEQFRACAPRHDNPCGAEATFEKVDFPAGQPRTAIGWFICPEALYWGPRFLYERYKVPMAITENGLSNTDWVGLDGKVQDPQRIDYTRRYLLALQRAVDDGADVRAYFHWSLLDNFEWALAYRERFGLIHVDFTTLKRTLKQSAHWYRTVIESNGAALATAQGS